MEQILLIDASPRAPHSNSHGYAAIFMETSRAACTYIALRKSDLTQTVQKIERSSDIIFVCPLYVDSLPLPLLELFQKIEHSVMTQKPRIHVILNCGFLEPWQNDTALASVRLFCRQNGFCFGSCLKIGGGEAILRTPFRFLVRHKIRHFSQAVRCENFVELSVTMPVSKRMFLRASTRYWIRYGKKHRLTREQMTTSANRVEGNR